MKTKEWIERSEYIKRRTTESRERRKRDRQEVFKLLSRLWNKFTSIFWMMVKMVFIGLISALSGKQSISLIYALNKPLGINYAIFASYIESALIGIILYIYIFGSNKKWKK